MDLFKNVLTKEFLLKDVMNPVLMMRLEKGKRRGKQVRCSNMQTVLYLTLEIRICAQWISLPSEKKIKGLREPLSCGLFFVGRPLEHTEPQLWF